MLIPQSSESSLPTAPPTVKKSVSRTNKSITLPQSPMEEMIKLDDGQDVLLDDSNGNDPFDVFSFQSITGDDTSKTEDSGQEGPSFIVRIF